jgi:hypothetical protein
MQRGLDKLTKERRSWNMSRIRGKDTTPEKIVRSLLHKMGFRFRLHVRIPLGEVRRANEKKPVRCSPFETRHSHFEIRLPFRFPFETRNSSFEIRNSRHRSAQIQNRHLRSRLRC